MFKAFTIHDNLKTANFKTSKVSKHRLCFWITAKYLKAERTTELCSGGLCTDPVQYLPPHSGF